ncbi:hypothetical protein ACHAXA_002901 [Cyclostephanos tholiformis]|uniref:Uncharacterized protein n=1 Tax=Cyclostephanos tholiformis TaxID=382380 RepID=A0ABD3SGH7_9STRA
MKLDIFKSTISALVYTVYTSEVNAIEEPILRGYDPNVSRELETSCQLGTAAGQMELRILWENSPFDSDCNNAWDLQAAADELKNEEFPDETGSWQTVAYNRCARDYGIDSEVNKILEQCFDDDSSQCISLGETAASIIVYAQVCDGYSAAKQEDYLQTCREVAYGICKGAIDDKIEQQCSGEPSSVSTSELYSLMGLWTNKGADEKSNDEEANEEANQEAHEEANQEANKEANQEAHEEADQKADQKADKKAWLGSQLSRVVHKDRGY